MRLKLPGYHDWLSRCRDDGPRGGVGLFIRDSKDLSVFILHIFELLFVEIINKSSRNIIVGVVYRSNTEPHADLDIVQHPDKAYNQFMNLYVDAFNTSFPIIEIRYKTAYLKREPWFTSGLIELSKTKAKLFSKKLTLPSEHNIKKYKEFNILHKRLQRRMKATYYENVLEETKNKIKKTWNTLKRLIGKTNDKSILPNSFQINNKPINDRQEAFNNFFSNIGLQTSNNVPKANKKF